MTFIVPMHRDKPIVLFFSAVYRHVLMYVEIYSNIRPIFADFKNNVTWIGVLQINWDREPNIIKTRDFIIFL